MQHHAGQAEALALATAHPRSPLAEAGGIAIGEGADEVVGGGRSGGGDHRLHVGIGAVEAQVVEHGALKQQAVLGHVAHLGAQAGELHLLHIVAIEQHRALLGQVEPVDQLHQGAFATAAETHDSHELARLDAEVEAIEQVGAAGGVAERHPLEVQVAAQGRQGRLLLVGAAGFRQGFHYLAEGR